MGFYIASIFGIDNNFLHLSFLDKFKTVSLALQPTPTTLLLSALYAFRAKFNNFVAFNYKISSTIFLLKTRIKHK